MHARLSIYENLELEHEDAWRSWTSTEGLKLSRALPGYQGLLTFIDRENRRLVGVGFYDSEENLRKSDEIMDAQVPDSLPEELMQVLPERSFVGLFEVIERDGV
jgi:hypothetical protein